VFPIFWRVALDRAWSLNTQGGLRRRMLQFFQKEWKDQGKFVDHYERDGRRLSALEALPLYATVHALALQEDKELARAIEQEKLEALRQNAPSNQQDQGKDEKMKSSMNMI